MKFVNRERRLRYLGFDDKWFMIGGIVTLSFVMDFLFNNSFMSDMPFIHKLISWSISLFFSVFYWSVTREVLIQYRKRLPKLKDVGKRVLLFILTLVVSIFTVDFIGVQVLTRMGINFQPGPNMNKLVPIIIVSLMTMAIYEAIYFYRKLNEALLKEEEAKRGIVQAQLDALRNQAQPHFFFNAMNTLRDIIDQNSKEEAKDFVDKISDVYRFILEAENSNIITLKDELKFARAYMHIQCERFGDKLAIEWNIPDDALDRMIVPMSLQLLLENAIKHNVVSRSRPLSIKVNVADDRISVINPIQQKSTQIQSTKLGLENIRQRYALISDEEVIISDGKEFRVSLPLLAHTTTKKIHASLNH